MSLARSSKALTIYNADMTLQGMQQKMQTSEAKYSNLIGKQATAYARAGVDIASGSPLLMMAHTAAQSGVEQESGISGRHGRSGSAKVLRQGGGVVRHNRRNQHRYFWIVTGWDDWPR